MSIIFRTSIAIVKSLRSSHFIANAYFWKAIKPTVRPIFVFLALFSFTELFSQNLPEQDCEGAIPVCRDTFTQAKGYEDEGNVEDLGVGTSCLGSEENNSVWYIFTVANPGLLEFDIAVYGQGPQDSIDYDFALFDITGKSCADIYNGGLEVRCNYAYSVNVTGLRPGYSQTSVPISNGLPFCAPLPVTAGQTFALLVDNFATSTFGYFLDFRGSTAFLRDTIDPQLSGVDSLTCDNTDSLILRFSEPVRCSSLDSTGSNFSITGPSAVTITEAYSPSCVSGEFTQFVVIRLANPITSGGNYNLSLLQGVADNCDNISLPASVPFFVPEKVIAGFSYQKFASCAADTFAFTDTSAGNILSYLWDFGDTTTSNAANPVKTYPIAGTYTVSLTISSDDCSDTYMDTAIVVTNTINAAIGYQQPACVNQSIQFSDLSGYSPAANFYWDFGNGISGEQNPLHFYSSSGTYTVQFHIVDNVNNCPSDTVSETVLVRDTILADFIVSDPACSEVPVTFTDRSTASPQAWEWTFPDGSAAASQNASFVFDDDGTYPVQLAVTDSFCGTDTLVQNIIILPRPEFYLGIDTFICFGETLTLSAYPGADSYLWSTGDTTQSIPFSAVPATVVAMAVLDGCPYRDSINIGEKMAGCSFAVAPSAFSPNNDGHNDLLRVISQRVKGYEIAIYNRWGEEVYRTKDTEETGWDGTFKGEPQDIGVFSYIVTWQALNGDTRVTSGTVTLVR